MITKRQKMLVDYLSQNSGRYINRKQILIDLADIYEYTNEQSMYSSSSARQLTRDVKEINDDFDTHYIILSNTLKGVKLATEKEELEKYLDKSKILCLKKLKTYWNKQKKYNLDGQIDLFKEEIVRIINCE